jgi:HlyD family secretion protein
MEARMTSPKDHRILTAVLILSAGAAAWGWMGTVTTIASGQAVLTGSLLNVTAAGPGQVAEITVRPGDTVQRGQPVARISAPLIATQLQQAEAALGAEPAAAIDGERDRLEQEIEGLAEQSRLAVEQVTQEEKLFAEHRIVAAQARAASLQREMASRRVRIEQLQAKLDHAEELERRVTTLRQELSRTIAPVSPSSGEVVEIKAQPGAPVNAGSPLLAIRPKQPAIEALAHIPPDQGKLVRPGMEAKLSPGSLRAIVLEVANETEVRLGLPAGQVPTADHYEVEIIDKRPLWAR